MNNYHDEIFKEIESIKENAADFINGMLPTEFVSKLDLSTLELDKDSYVNENLKEHFSDLVYNCVYRGKTKIKISLLFEHKSSVPENPYLQLLEYIVGGWKALRKKKEPIIPIVCVIFYHGEAKWIKREFKDYFKGVDDDLLKYIPLFEYMLADITVYPDDKILYEMFKRVANSILLILMKHIKDEKYIDVAFEKIFIIGKNYFEQEEGERFLISIFTYVFENTDLDSDKIIERSKNISDKGGALAMSTATRLREKGRAEGRQEGIKEGEKKGKVEGLKEGEKRGEKKGKLEAAKRMFDKGLDLSLIVEITGLTTKEIKQYCEKKQ